ncbi:MAG TPA: 3-methyl-2-oxobutanoate hydroxymethyltransferase [Candidatus Dormibacteraeota bacterium]|jgi:3-methyl-2-oxobutanoate hydroxymethyltransferase|nr:3-methyl-2-oxobutanoate hydroxymethyltransferase [Candidatus Dormibacteraeota bacterium]
MPVTISDLLSAKREGRRFVMVTAYDYPTARLLAEADVPVLLVGDSVGNNALGYPSTLPVTMEDMLHHARAVSRGAPNQLLVGDMPFGAYHTSDDDAVANAVAFLKNGMHAVKLEGGGRVIALARRLVERGIPVMGHLGLTPQFLNLFGGFKVQGRSDEARAHILEDARALEEAGAFAIVLEGIPRSLAAEVTSAVGVPTIGIGAGPDCDAQVLVVYDLLGITRDRMPKFVKPYADLGDRTVAAARAFADEVAAGAFPDDEHSYH